MLMAGESCSATSTRLCSISSRQVHVFLYSDTRLMTMITGFDGSLYVIRMANIFGTPSYVCRQCACKRGALVGNTPDNNEGISCGRRPRHVLPSLSPCCQPLKPCIVFWRSDKLRQLVPLAVQHVPIAVQVNVRDGKEAVSECLCALIAVIDDDVMAKSLNLDVLMHSRSEDARIRLFSLSCAEQLWRSQGEKLLGTWFPSSCSLSGFLRYSRQASWRKQRRSSQRLRRTRMTGLFKRRIR